MLENYQITINKEFHLVGNETNLREVTTLVLQLYQRDFSLYGKKVLEQIRNFELFFLRRFILISVRAMHKLNVFIFGGFFSTNAATVLCKKK